MDHDNAILIDGNEYSMSSCQTVYDMKKAIFHEMGLFVKHVKAGATILLNSQKLLNYADTKLTGVLDEQIYLKYKENGWRCVSCRGSYKFDTMTCDHSDKCRSKGRKIRLLNSSFSQVDMVSTRMDLLFQMNDEIYFLKNVYTILDIKRYILLNFDKVVTEIYLIENSQKIQLHGSTTLEKFLNFQFYCVINESFFKKDKKRGYRCQRCFNYLNLNSMKCSHTSKCRKIYSNSLRSATLSKIQCLLF